MDISTGISIAALILVVPLGIATNLLTPRVVGYLEKRKLLKTHRSKTQEIAAYRRVEEFKKVTRDRYAFYFLLATCSILFMILSFVPLAFAVLALLGAIQVNIIVTVTLAAVFLFVSSIICLLGIQTTAARIERFDEYTAEMKTKWGNDAI